jgi:hypothetical protein
MRFSYGELAVLAMLTILAMSGGVAIAGPVQIKLFDSSSYDNWLCGISGPSTLAGTEASCGSAKFGKCSDCPGLLIRNTSHAAVKLEVKIAGPGFQHECKPGAYVGSMQCPSGKSIPILSGQNECRETLSPEASCLVPSVEFCPQRDGAVHGEVIAFVSAASGPHQVVSFPLAGAGDYTPDLAAADKARRRHLGELTSLPHVAKVELDNTGGDIAIDVEVAEGNPIDPVRRAVPPEIEGYRTEVTTYEDIGCGY